MTTDRPSVWIGGDLSPRAWRLLAADPRPGVPAPPDLTRRRSPRCRPREPRKRRSTSGIWRSLSGRSRRGTRDRLSLYRLRGVGGDPRRQFRPHPRGAGRGAGAGAEGPDQGRLHPGEPDQRGRRRGRLDRGVLPQAARADHAGRPRGGDGKRPLRLGVREAASRQAQAASALDRACSSTAWPRTSTTRPGSTTSARAAARPSTPSPPPPARCAANPRPATGGSSRRHRSTRGRGRAARPRVDAAQHHPASVDSGAANPVQLVRPLDQSAAATGDRGAGGFPTNGGKRCAHRFAPCCTGLSSPDSPCPAPPSAAGHHAARGVAVQRRPRVHQGAW